LVPPRRGTVTTLGLSGEKKQDYGGNPEGQLPHRGTDQGNKDNTTHPGMEQPDWHQRGKKSGIKSGSSQKEIARKGDPARGAIKSHNVSNSNSESKESKRAELKTKFRAGERHLKIKTKTLHKKTTYERRRAKAIAS